MEQIKKQAEKYFSNSILTLQKWININSIYDASTVSEGAPFGKGVKEALQFIGNLAKNDGFDVFALLCNCFFAGVFQNSFRRAIPMSEIKIAILSRGKMQRLHRRLNWQRATSAKQIRKRFFHVLVGVVESGVD